MPTSNQGFEPWGFGLQTGITPPIPLVRIHQRVLKKSDDRQMVQEELQQKNEDARKSCQTLEKQQAFPAPNIISQNEEEPAKQTRYQTRSVTQEAIMSKLDMYNASTKLTARNKCSQGFHIYN